MCSNSLNINQTFNQTYRNFLATIPSNIDVTNNLIVSQDNPKDNMQLQKILIPQDILKKQQIINKQQVRQEDVYGKIEQFRIKQIVQFFRQIKISELDVFNKIVKKINQLKAKGIEDEIKIILQMRQITQDNFDLCQRFHSILTRVTQINQQPSQQQNKIQKNEQKNQIVIIENQIIKQQSQPENSEVLNNIPQNDMKTCQNPSNSNTIENQILLFQYLFKNLSLKQYQQIIKIIYLYQIGILNKFQVLHLVPKHIFSSSQDYRTFKNCIQSRQNQRRLYPLYSVYSPTQSDFSQWNRLTHSYIQMPILYPTICSGKKKFVYLKKVLNSQLICVKKNPSNDFNIRIKNDYQQALSKNEDQIYLFDLNLYRYKLTLQLLQKLIQISQIKQVQITLDKILKMGIIQTMYRHASIEDKVLIQTGLKQNSTLLVTILIQRLYKQIETLQNLRNDKISHQWKQHSEKNFHKSLEVRSFLFNYYDRQCLKIQSFNYQMKNVIKRQPKVLNTFQGLSTSQFVHHNNIVNLDFQQKNSNNPFLVMYFQNKSILKLSMRLIIMYIDSFQYSHQNQKSNMKQVIFKDFIMKFFKIQLDSPQGLEQINYQQLILELKQYLPITKKQVPKNEIARFQFQLPNTISEINKRNKKNQQYIDQKFLDRYQRIQILPNDNNKVQLLPIIPKNNRYSIMYGSGLVYYLFRLLYRLYQRILRAYQICNIFQYHERSRIVPKEKLKIAEKRFMLFLHSFKKNIKNRENSKFQENLKQIFGQSSYLFYSFIKIFQSIAKVALLCINDKFTLDAITLFNQQIFQSQQIYQHHIHNQWLNISYQCVLFRFSYKQNLLYVNNFDSIYKQWLQDKKDKDHNDFSKKMSKIQNFVFQKANRQPLDNKILKPPSKKVLIKNNMEYMYLPKTQKMVAKQEDLLFRKKQLSPRLLKKQFRLQLKRINKMLQKWQNLKVVD